MHPLIGRGFAMVRDQGQIFKTIAALILGTYIFITLAHSGVLRKRLDQIRHVRDSPSAAPIHHHLKKNLTEMLDDSTFNMTAFAEASSDSTRSSALGSSSGHYTRKQTKNSPRRYYDSQDDSFSEDGNTNYYGYGKTSQKKGSPRGGYYNQYDDDDYDDGPNTPNNRPNYDYYDNYGRVPTAAPPTKSPEDQLKDMVRTINQLERNEKLNGLHDRLDELRQRQKIRDAMRAEADWAEEQEDQREKEREMQRVRWEVKERNFLRWKEHTDRHENILGESALDYKDRWMKRNHGGDSYRPTYESPLEQQTDTDDDDTEIRTAWHQIPKFKGLAPPELNAEEQEEARRCPGLVPKKRFMTYSKFLPTIAQPEFAYVTFVTSHEFVMPAAVLMHSVAVSGSQYARAICVTPEISAGDRSKLGLFAQIIEIERVPSPLTINNDRYKDTFTKLRMWELIMFKRILYVDTDVVAIRNMDALFDISEWGVTMDAEQSRYSTGMMILEPSKETFKRMLEKLKTTRVSMELPDLLFLKEYFDEFHPDAHINLIPRWFQVYQEEFGSSYSSYLTKRKQKLTIFDPRIHGMHFPGAGKPWLGGFEEKYRKFSIVFCHWTQAKDYKYNSQLHWFLQYEMMQRSMIKEKQKIGIAFDFDAGSSVTVLTEYIKKQEEEEKKRDNWGYGGGRYNYNYNNYAPVRDTTTNTGNNAAPGDATQYKWVYKDGTWQKVAVAGDEKSSLDSLSTEETDLPIFYEPDVEKLWNSNAECVAHVDIDTAMQSVRLPRSRNATRDGLFLGERSPVSSNSSRRVPFSVGSLNFTMLEPLVFKLRQMTLTAKEDQPKGSERKGNTPKDIPVEYEKTFGDTYEWFVNWCSKSKVGPPEAKRCGKPSYITQYSDGECRSNFDEGLSLLPVWSKSTKKCLLEHSVGFSSQSVMNRCFNEQEDKSRALSGVVFRSKVTIDSPTRIRWMELQMRCDWTMPPNVASIERNSSAYSVKLVKTPHDRLYIIKLRSRCACLGGCREKLSTTPAEAPSADPAEKKFERYYSKWKSRQGGYTFANKCITAGKDFNKCFGTKPGCSFDVTRKRCIAPVDDKWLRVVDASAKRVCNCSHVGGSGDGKILSLEECRNRAEGHGANVINFFNTYDVEDDARPKSKETLENKNAGKKQFKGGCYYKKCSFDQILKAQVSLTHPPPSEKYHVEILNPFYGLSSEEKPDPSGETVSALSSSSSSEESDNEFAPVDGAD